MEKTTRMLRKSPKNCSVRVKGSPPTWVASLTSPFAFCTFFLFLRPFSLVEMSRLILVALLAVVGKVAEGTSSSSTDSSGQCGKIGGVSVSCAGSVDGNCCSEWLCVGMEGFFKFR